MAVMTTAPRSRVEGMEWYDPMHRCDAGAIIAQRFVQGTRNAFHGTRRAGVIIRTVFLNSRLSSADAGAERQAQVEEAQS
jgi:hypothetical protein